MYVVIEGIDGSGKTTLVDTLRPVLGKLCGVNNVVFHREPSPLSEAQIYFQNRSKGGLYHPIVAAGLMVGDRTETVQWGRALMADRTKLLVSDRGFLSTFAYQGMDMARMVKDPDQFPKAVWSAFEMLWDMHTGIPLPDLTIYLDCPPDMALMRVADRAEGEHLSCEQVEQAWHGYMAAVSYLRDKMGTEWMRDHFLVLPVTETIAAGGARDEAARDVTVLAQIVRAAVEAALTQRGEVC